MAGLKTYLDEIWTCMTCICNLLQSLLVFWRERDLSFRWERDSKNDEELNSAACMIIGFLDWSHPVLPAFCEWVSLQFLREIAFTKIFCQDLAAFFVKSPIYHTFNKNWFFREITCQIEIVQYNSKLAIFSWIRFASTIFL